MWEQLLQVPASPSISPLDLCLKYVELTSDFVPSGSPFLRALKPPYIVLQPNSIGCITKDYLNRLGCPLGAFGPHSTRGAGVKMYKNFGFSTEQVCEIGKWKNTHAFSPHYLRLGATSVAGHKI